MSNLLIVSAVPITMALLFYSLGVWAERLARYLKPWHVLAFWMGFLFDICGTLVMHKLSQSSFNLLEIHTFTGQVALWLMLIHATWATVVIRKGGENILSTFHRYSLFVWLIWLIPYFGGMYVSMSK